MFCEDGLTVNDLSQFLKQTRKWQIFQNMIFQVGLKKFSHLYIKIQSVVLHTTGFVEDTFDFEKAISDTTKLLLQLTCNP